MEPSKFLDEIKNNENLTSYTHSKIPLKNDILAKKKKLKFDLNKK